MIIFKIFDVVYVFLFKRKFECYINDKNVKRGGMEGWVEVCYYDVVLINRIWGF